MPHATVGTAAPTTNIRTETNTAWVTCARTTASSLEMAAIISATQARNPITLRAIRAVINRCPIVTLLTERRQLCPTAPYTFDHLRRHRQAEFLGGLEIDHEVELCPRLHGSSHCWLRSGLCSVVV